MTSSVRPYAGVTAQERLAVRREALLKAGLEGLGGVEDATLTVRGVCAASGVVARYFYEIFDDIADLAIAVHEKVIDELIAHALASLAKAPADEPARVRAGVTAIVEHLAQDRRRGRVIFVATTTHAALTARRAAMVAVFAELLAAQAQSFYGTARTPGLEAIARFLVGGFGEALTAWQSGELSLSQDQLIDTCVTLFVSSASSIRALEGGQDSP